MSTSSPFSPPEESAPAWILVATSRLRAAQAELDRTLYRVPWSLTQLLRHPCEDDWIWKQKIQLSRQEQVVLFILLPVLSIIATRQGVALAGSFLNTTFSATQRAMLTFMVSAIAILHRLRYTLWHDRVRKPVKEQLQVLDAEAKDLARALEASLKAELATLKAATKELTEHRATLQGPPAPSATAQATNAVGHLVRRENTVVDPPDISAHELTALINEALQEAAALTDRLRQLPVGHVCGRAHYPERSARSRSDEHHGADATPDGEACLARWRHFHASRSPDSHRVSLSLSATLIPSSPSRDVFFTISPLQSPSESFS